MADPNRAREARIELKEYFKDRPPRWISPSKEAKRFLAESAYPVELLAVVVWDCIKELLPYHTVRLRLPKEDRRALRNKPPQQFRIELKSPNSYVANYFAKKCGYNGARDQRLPLSDGRRSSEGEFVVSGDRAKSPRERRMNLDARGRKRWPQPAGNLLDIKSPMRSYWRRHRDFRVAQSAFMNALRGLRSLKSAVTEADPESDRAWEAN
jgi:hypothetical protein